MAYRAVVDTAYRQSPIDRSVRAETRERETTTPAMSHTEVEDLGSFALLMAAWGSAAAGVPDSRMVIS